MDSPLSELQGEYDALFKQKEDALYQMVEAVKSEDENKVQTFQTEALRLEEEGHLVRSEVKELVKKVSPDAETNDKDYIFMTYVMDYLPVGMIGLLFAVMFSAAMSSTASELNALSSTTTVDIYKRSIKKNGSDLEYLKSSRWFTFMWGALAILFATYASLFENLIQAVNLLGSIFYGTILGIFLVAFYFKRIQGNAVFIAAILAEIVVILIHYLNANEIAPSFLTMGYLWYNVVGCVLVILFGFIIQFFSKSNKE